MQKKNEVDMEGIEPSASAYKTPAFTRYTSNYILLYIYNIICIKIDLFPILNYIVYIIKNGVSKTKRNGN